MDGGGGVTKEGELLVLVVELKLVDWGKLLLVFGMEALVKPGWKVWWWDGLNGGG